MPATQRTKITRKDIHKAESLPTLIGEMVKRIKEANDEVKEHAATALQSIAQMDHGEHADTLYKAGAVKPLVGLLANGSADAQSHASSALAHIVQRKPEHQQALVEADATVCGALCAVGHCNIYSLRNWTH